jgi:hypothetical protein
MGTRTRAWGLGFLVGVGMAVGACFNPPIDTQLTTSGLGCMPGTRDCPCVEPAACDPGLTCVDAVCVDDDPTGTSGATGMVTTGPGDASVDDTSSSTAPPGETTLALDDTTTGGATTGDATTGDATTGDASTGPGSSSTGMPPEPAMETVNFPTAADPRFFASGSLPWNAGDWIEGVRDTIVPSVSQLDVHIPIVSNGLTDCGFQEADVILNGVTLGSFVVAQGTAVIDQSFPAPAVVGPQYTIRYQTTATVAGGCGSAGYDETLSTVTLWE